jgi:NAD(P)-dependent dehydrogenase (short-subunit alcohol dehydrogenase family)
VRGRMNIRTALITAAANGIGRATAQRLADEGVRTLPSRAAVIQAAGKPERPISIPGGDAVMRISQRDLVVIFNFSSFLLGDSCRSLRPNT